jgi:hypothetical protein
VLGKSTTIRAGEDKVSTVGVSAPFDVISMLMPPLPRVTLIFCNAA